MLLTYLNTISLNLFTVSFKGQLFFQKSSTEIMQCIVSLHNDIMFLIIVILFFVLCVLWRIIYFYSAKRISTHITLISVLKLKKYFTIFWNYIFVKIIALIPNTKRRKVVLIDYDDSHFFFLIKIDPIRLNFTHHTLLEQIWTLIPTLILFSILLPSMTLIYMMDNIFDNSIERSALITLKIAGNQWYWTYQTSNGCLTKPITFDSYLENNIGMSPGEEYSEWTDPQRSEHGPLRLLKVDKEVYLPVNTKIRLLITSNDVIHSWAIPSCGIKMDAVPGRINSTGLEVNSFGRKIGQCSELCGTGHAFMPIVIRIVPLARFLEMLII